MSNEQTQIDLMSKMKKYVISLKTEVREIHEQRRALEKAYKDGLLVLDQKLKEVRERCPHLETNYIPDASGNNDSYYDCKWCGASSNRGW